MNSGLRLALAMSAALILSACFVKEIQGSHSRSADETNPDNPPALNSAPVISGTPSLSSLQGQPYEFVPTASDADGDTLEFSISRKPAWASFSRSTGRLWGTPDAGDVGSFTNIKITVSDGEAAASLRDFNITVDAIALGQATLSWMPPTQNEDGTPLTDLAGYRIYYGRNQGDLTRIAVLNNPGLTRYVVDNLTPAKWYFTMTSVNSDGVESGRSAVLSKTIT